MTCITRAILISYYIEEVHLLNFVYKRAHDNKYIQAGNRDLRRFDAPILREDIANNRSFEKKCVVPKCNSVESAASGG